MDFITPLTLTFMLATIAICGFAARFLFEVAEETYDDWKESLSVLGGVILCGAVVLQAFVWIAIICVTITGTGK